MSTPELDLLLNRLDLVRRVSSGFMARCPAHEDRTPSLSVRLIDGEVACHCFGCGAGKRDVYQALGLPWEGRSAPPREPWRQALPMAQHQPGHQMRDIYATADTVRELERIVEDLRRAATLMGGEDDDAWDCLELAAELERNARNL